MDRYLSDKIWDIWCCLSVIGIWPRFIEPQLLMTTHLSLPIKHLPAEIDGLKILQFSDLHLGPHLSDRFLNRLQKKILQKNADLVVFTGDFLCYSVLENSQRLKKFLDGIHAPFGCYAIYGNHDYEQNVSVNDQGDYDVINRKSSTIKEGFHRLLSPITPTGKVTEAASGLHEHNKLISILEKSPFEILHNRCKIITIKGFPINLCGVGEHMLGRCNPEIAFQDYNRSLPGIILAHNPDCVPELIHFPGDVILSGHTHGAQVNLPWLWRKYMILENTQYKRGLVKLPNDKWLYVNRGVGSTLPFRWFSPPEITIITLKKSYEN